MQLRRKFLLAFALVSVTIAGVHVVTFDSQRDAAVASEREDAAEQAALTASTIDGKLVEKRRAVAIAADHPALTAHGSAAQSDRLAAIRDRSDFGGVSVVAANGTMTALVAGDNVSATGVVGLDYGDRTYVQRALGGEVYVSDPISARTGNRIVVVSAPIRSDGEIVGTLNGAFYLSGSALLGSVERLGDDTDVRITAGDRTLYDGPEEFESRVRGRERVDATGWVVTVERRQSAVTAQVRRLAVVQAVTGIAMLGAVALFGLWIYRSDVRQAERLRDQFRRLEAGEHDRRVELAGSAEWTEIGRSVNRLSATLARREQMLLVLNRLLRHNLRNSLNVVIGRADLLAESTRGRDREYAEEIRAVADELLDLSGRARKTEELMTRDRSRTGSSVDVAAVVAERVAAFRERRGDADVAVESPPVAYAAIDAELSTVVDELLANTVDHAGPNPTVRVAVERAGETVELRVSDDGPGVPSDEREVLSGEREIGPLHHTGGLGLWLVDWIVARAGGTVEIRTDDGTTVVVRLPAASSRGDAS